MHFRTLCIPLTKQFIIVLSAMDDQSHVLKNLKPFWKKLIWSKHLKLDLAYTKKRLSEVTGRGVVSKRSVQGCPLLVIINRNYKATLTESPIQSFERFSVLYTCKTCTVLKLKLSIKILANLERLKFLNSLQNYGS